MAYSDHLKSSASVTPTCAIITLSDTRNAETDKSGQLIRQLLSDNHCVIGGYEIIPDDPARLKSQLETYLAAENIQAIITNGGTGIARRDQTIDVVQSMIQIPLPGFGEIFRMLSYEQIGAGAILSRAIAGICNGKPIFSLPGSSAAVELGMNKLIIPELRHILSELRKST